MVIDLHSDYLSYLTSSPEHTPFDGDSRSSPLQMKQGKVHTLVTVTYAPKDIRSFEEAPCQMKAYHALIRDLPNIFIAPSCEKAGHITLIPAIENASSFASEGEPLENAFERFSCCFRRVPPLYISLTWNEENRFGGGAHTSVGLKEDGKSLLNFLEGKVFAIDLSHASDRLARDIIEYSEARALHFTMIASHSNFREITSHKRNLPHDIASHIVKNNGIIGLTLVESFVGKTLEAFFDHIAYGLQNGFQDHLAFGGDFFSPTGLKQVSEIKPRYHFPNADSSACFPSILQQVEERFSLEISQALAEKNADRLLINPYIEMIRKGIFF